MNHVDVEPLFEMKEHVGYCVTWNHRRILKEYTVRDGMTETPRPARLAAARRRAFVSCQAIAIRAGLASALRAAGP